MRVFAKYLALLLMCCLLLGGCSDNPKKPSSSGQIIQQSDTCFITVTLEGTGAETSRVTASKAEKNDEGVWVGVKSYEMSTDGSGTYCTTVEEDGNYIITAERGDQPPVTRYVVLNRSKVCSLHLCLDDKPASKTRTLWPNTPHNSPDSE